MASLKDLRNRIKTVKSTERITSAMKMVAAAKLKKSEDRVSQARPFFDKMESMLGKLSGGMGPEAPTLLVGRGTAKNKKILLLVITSDRGLCGGFNGTMVKEVRKKIRALQDAGHTVSLMVVGRKGVNLLRRDFPKNIVASFEELCKPIPPFAGADMLAQKIIGFFNSGEIDECQLVYTKYLSAITQIVTPLSLIPFQAAPQFANDNKKSLGETSHGDQSITEFEPDEETILIKLLPQNLAVQVYRGLLESFASEQGARMTAMDNATRNARDMINKLTITYNRSRQAQITKELIEIISGAEAV